MIFFLKDSDNFRNRKLMLKVRIIQTAEDQKQFEVFQSSLQQFRVVRSSSKYFEAFRIKKNGTEFTHLYISSLCQEFIVICHNLGHSRGLVSMICSQLSFNSDVCLHVLNFDLIRYLNKQYPNILYVLFHVSGSYKDKTEMGILGQIIFNLGLIIIFPTSKQYPNIFQYVLCTMYCMYFKSYGGLLLKNII